MRIAVCGLLLLAAVAVGSLGAPRGQRRMVLFAGFVLVVNWLFYASSWVAPAYSPAWVIHDQTNIDATPRQMWALTDAVSATLILGVGITVQHRAEKWCLALWLLLVCQIATHGLVASDAIGAGVSLKILDLFFYGQLAVFLLIGRKGVSDVVRELVLRLGSRRRDLFASAKAAHKPPPRRKV